MTNNCEYIETFGRVETKQEEVNSLYAGKYRGALKKSKVSKVMFEMALVNNEIDELESSTDFDNITEKQKKVVLAEVKKLDAKKSKLEKQYQDLGQDENEIVLMEAANDIMILGSLIGNFLEAGYLKKDGTEIKPTIEAVQSFPQKMKTKLLENAIALYKVDSAESGN
jgi:hypothetical protein